MTCFIPLLYFLLSNLTTTLLFKQKFGKSLIFTMFLSSLILYISQLLFNTFKVGLTLNIIYSLLFVILIIKTKDKERIKGNYFSAGFFTFIFLFVFVIIYDFNRKFTMWDEFSHWGVMLKEMLRIDNFYTDASSTLMAHKDYPPIVQLFEYFWIKLTLTYKEKYVISSLHIFELSLFIPFLSDKIEKNMKNIIKFLLKVLLLFVSILLILLLFDLHNVMNSIYIDYFMAILISFLLVYILTEEKVFSTFNILLLTFGFSFLLLTKQIGIPFYLMILFALFLKTIKELKNNDYKKNLLIIFLLVIVPIINLELWNNYISQFNLTKQFVLSDIKLRDLIGIIHGTMGEEYQILAAKNYIEQLRVYNLTSSSFISITYFKSLAIFLLLSLIFYIKNRKNLITKDYIIYNISIILGAFGYAFVMLNMYVFCFKEIEGPNLASFDRYMDTFILIEYFSLLMYFIKYNKNHVNYIFMLLLLYLISNSSLLVKVFPKVLKSNKTDYELVAEDIISKTSEDSKIFLIAQNEIGSYMFYVKYYINPRVVNRFNFSLEQGDNVNIEDYFYSTINDYMLDFDYVYIVFTNDDFNKKYNFLFNNETRRGQLYRIINNQGRVNLLLE